MKTLILFAALLLGSIANKTFANDVTVKVTPAVMQSFNTSFQNATNVQWSVVEHLYRAEFTIDDEKTIAFFSMADGTLVASCHYLTLSELPHKLQNSLKTAAGSDNITEIFTVQNDDGTDYFATVQKESKGVILKAGSTKWDVYKKG